MKNLLNFGLVLLLLLPFTQIKAERSLRRYFELEGKIFKTGFDAKGTEKYLDSATILIKNTETGICDTLFSAESGGYIFRLPLNNDFQITICKEGFVSKKLHVDTHVPLFTTGYYGMEFELGLYKSISEIDVSSLLDQPVADIFYKSKKKTFDYDHNYTDQVNRNLKKAYASYYQHKTVTVVAVKKPDYNKLGYAKIGSGKGKKALRISGGKIHR